MTITENILRFAGDTKPVTIAGRMTEAGCETSETSVRRWFEGGGDPSPEKIPYLAQALNVSIGALYDGMDIDTANVTPMRKAPM